MNWKHEQIIEKFKQNGIAIDDFHILIDSNVLDGQEIYGCSFSKDERWICAPVYDDEASCSTGKYEYMPKCFEIKSHYETWVSNGSMMHKCDVWLLRD